MEETLKNASDKYVDVWAKYSLTSRISIGLFVLLYIVSTIALMYISVPLGIAKVIMETTSMVAMLSVIMVIVGNNTFVKIVEIMYNRKTAIKFEDIAKEQEKEPVENTTYAKGVKPING